MKEVKMSSRLHQDILSSILSNLKPNEDGTCYELTRPDEATPYYQLGYSNSNLILGGFGFSERWDSVVVSSYVRSTDALLRMICERLEEEFEIEIELRLF